MSFLYASVTKRKHLVVNLSRGQQCFSVKSQTVNILGFTAIGFLLHLLNSACRSKAAIDDTEMNGRGFGPWRGFAKL